MVVRGHGDLDNERVFEKRTIVASLQRSMFSLDQQVTLTASVSWKNGRTISAPVFEQRRVEAVEMRGQNLNSYREDLQPMLLLVHSFTPYRHPLPLAARFQMTTAAAPAHTTAPSAMPYRSNLPSSSSPNGFGYAWIGSRPPSAIATNNS